MSQKYLLSGKIKNKIPFILMGIGVLFYILALLSPLTNLIKEKENSSHNYKKNETHQKQNLKEKASSHHKEENRHDFDKSEHKKENQHEANNNENHAPSYKKIKIFSLLLSFVYFFYKLVFRGYFFCVDTISN